MLARAIGEELDCASASRSATRVRGVPGRAGRERDGRGVDQGGSSLSIPLCEGLARGGLTLVVAVQLRKLHLVQEPLAGCAEDAGSDDFFAGWCVRLPMVGRASGERVSRLQRLGRSTLSGPFGLLAFVGAVYTIPREVIRSGSTSRLCGR
jgi:hypothetical protein